MPDICAAESPCHRWSRSISHSLFTWQRSMVQVASSSWKTISLKAADSVVFVVEPFIVKEMQNVQSFIDEDATIAATAIPLPNVYSRELNRIVDYCRAPPLSLPWCRCRRQQGRQWLRCGIREGTGPREVEGAHPGGVLNLQKFVTLTTASHIQNKSVEFVRKFFGIVNDYTPEEEAKLMHGLSRASTRMMIFEFEPNLAPNSTIQ